MSNIARITVTSCLLVRALEILSLFYLLTFSLLMWYVHIVMRGRCWTAQAVLLTLAGDSQGFPLSPATSAELQGHSGESVDHPFCPQLLAVKIWKLLVIFIQKLPTTNYYTTHTHTRLTALFPGLPRWAGTRKVKPIWILLKQEIVSGSGISLAICKSAPCFRQIATTAPHHSVFYRPDAIPAAQPTASKHWRP